MGYRAGFNQTELQDKPEQHFEVKGGNTITETYGI